MLQAWYRYADRVGRYEAGPKDAPRVVVMVAVGYALFGIVIPWPLLAERNSLLPLFWMGLPFVMALIACVLTVMLERFRARDYEVATPGRVILSIVVLAWTLVSMTMDFPVAAVFGPLWGLLPLDAMTHVTKVLRSAKKDAATPVGP